MYTSVIKTLVYNDKNYFPFMKLEPSSAAFTFGINSTMTSGAKLPGAMAPGRLYLAPTVAPFICGSSVWNLLHVTLLMLRILRWIIGFLKNLDTPAKANYKTNTCT
jgi:hypothetical protein